MIARTFPSAANLGFLFIFPCPDDRPFYNCMSTATTLNSIFLRFEVRYVQDLRNSDPSFALTGR